MSLVPSALGMARYAAPYVFNARKRQRFSQAASLGKFAYQNRKYIYKAAKTFRGRRKPGSRSRAPRKSKTYDSASTSTFKTSYNPDTRGLDNTQLKTFVSGYVTMPEKGTTSTSRLTDSVFVKGVDLCFHVLNTTARTFQLHVALVQQPCDETTQTQLREGFFRGDSPEATSIDFVNRTQDPAWDIRYLCNAINPDNKKVLMHKKFLLDVGRLTANSPRPAQEQSKSIVHHSEYISINKVFKLRGGDTNPNRAEKPLVWCLWVMPLDPNDMLTGDAFSFNVREKLYFKNVC